MAGVVEISDIKDRARLKDWLDALPRDRATEAGRARAIAVTIASRAAARVLPDWWRFVEVAPAKRRDLTAAVLRCVMTSVVATVRPTTDVRRAASADARAASASASADASAFAARADADAADADAASWRSVRMDCQMLVEGRDPFCAPLWASDNPLREVWDGVRRALEQNGTAPDWAFFLEWYENLLDPKGRAPNWDLLEEIVLIDDAVWQAGPEALLPVVNEIWRKYELDTPRDPDTEVDTALENQPAPKPALIEKVRERVAENRADLPPTIGALQEFILLEIERWQRNNFLNAEMPDLCRSQIATYLTMYEALDRLPGLIPPEGTPSEEEAERIIGLGTLYKTKLMALPRDNADAVVQKVWETSGNVVDLGLVVGSSALLMKLGLPPNPSIALGAMAFGRNKAKQVISSAKGYLKGQSGT